MLAFWLLPEDIGELLAGELEGDIEMFFISGICMVGRCGVDCHVQRPTFCCGASPY